MLLAVDGALADDGVVKIHRLSRLRVEVVVDGRSELLGRLHMKVPRMPESVTKWSGLCAAGCSVTMMWCCANERSSLRPSRHTS